MRKPIRVLQLISSLEVGGAEKLLLSLIETSQNDHRVEFTMVVMNKDVNPVLQAQLAELGCTVYYLNRPESHKHPKYLALLLNIIRRHKIDILHAHNYGSKLWAVLCKMSQPQLKLAITVHDTGIISGLNGFHHWLHGNVIDLNIAISRAVERECRAHGVNNLQQIYNGIPVERFRPPLDSRRQPNGTLNIINIARMDHRKKGQDILLRALRLCRIQGLPFHCRLVGGVHTYNRDSFSHLQQLTEALDLADCIEFITNRSDVTDLLHQSDLFVLPSRFEGLGLVILEAMAAGVPVIASRIDGPAELISDNVNGLLFEAEQESKLAEKIMQMARQPETLARLKKNAYHSVESFDISIMNECYVEAYQALRLKDSMPVGLERFKAMEINP